MTTCRCCGIRCYGGSPARQAAQQCSRCWERAIAGRLEESARRSTRYTGRQSLANLVPGARVQKVKVERLFGNVSPPQIGEVVEAPVFIGGNNWEVLVRWDGRSRPDTVNTRRVQIIHG